MNGQPTNPKDAFNSPAELIRQAVALAVAHASVPTEEFMKTLDMGDRPSREGFWRPSVDGSGVVTFSGKYYRRGPQILSVPEASEGSLSAVLSGTTVYLGIRWNTITGSGTIISGPSFTDVIDTSVPEDSEFIKAPICSMVTEDGANWYEDENFRSLLATALYV